MPEAYLHEFGHALGLYDLYHFRDSGPSIMDASGVVARSSVPDDDVNYVHKVYDGHPTPVHRTEEPQT